MLAKGFVIFNKKWLIPFLPLTFLNYTYKICIHSQKAQQNRWRQTAVTTFSYCHASPSSDVTGTPSSQAVMVNSMVSIIPLHAFTSQRLRNIVPFYWSQWPNHFSSHFNKMQVRSMASKIPVIWLLFCPPFPPFLLSLTEFLSYWPPFVLQTQKLNPAPNPCLDLLSPLPGTLPFRSLIKCHLL